MVNIEYSYSSDDSTVSVCSLPEKDALEDRFTRNSSASLSSEILSTNMVDVKDIEGNIIRPTKKDEIPKVIHPGLLRIPIQVRFFLAGAISNVIFMITYNKAIPHLETYIAASTIYAIVYFFFIPVSHAFSSLVVFGWPKEYLKSLLSNFPIGLSAIAIGSALTAYLDRIFFETSADEFVREHITKKPRLETDDVEEIGEFYSSLVVMIITGVWTYVISVMVNTGSSEPHKKDL